LTKVTRFQTQTGGSTACKQESRANTKTAKTTVPQRLSNTENTKQANKARRPQARAFSAQFQTRSCKQAVHRRHWRLCFQTNLTTIYSPAARKGTEEALVWDLQYRLGKMHQRLQGPRFPTSLQPRVYREGLPCLNDNSIPRIPHNPSCTHATSDTVAMQFRQLVDACRLTSHLLTHMYACNGQLLGSYPVRQD
jgi:hypothetical protein